MLSYSLLHSQCLEQKSSIGTFGIYGSVEVLIRYTVLLKKKKKDTPAKELCMWIKKHQLRAKQIKIDIYTEGLQNFWNYTMKKKSLSNLTQK